MRAHNAVQQLGSTVFINVRRSVHHVLMLHTTSLIIIASAYCT